MSVLSSLRVLARALVCLLTSLLMRLSTYAPVNFCTSLFMHLSASAVCEFDNVYQSVRLPDFHCGCV